MKNQLLPAQERQVRQTLAVPLQPSAVADSQTLHYTAASSYNRRQ